MKDKNELKVEGIVEESFPNTMFRVKLQDGREILAHLSGRLRLNFIRVIPGDKVMVELSPYDEKRGRIIKRL